MLHFSSAEISCPCKGELICVNGVCVEPVVSQVVAPGKKSGAYGLGY